MTFLRALDRLWYAPAKAERLAVLRILVGAYALIFTLVRYPSLTSVTRFDASQFEPVGPVSLLTTPFSSSIVHTLTILSVALGACFVAGLAYRLTAPLYALSFLWITSYRSSWGMIFHTENLVVFHLLLLALAPAADVVSVDARRKQGELPTEPHGRYGWAIRALSLVTIVTYVLAGVAKLRLSGLHWADGEILRAQIGYDNLRKIELGSLHSPLGAWLVRFAWPFRPLAWCSLLLELGAPVALLGRRLAQGWVVGVFAFHLGVVALMAIGFPYQLSFVAYASFFSVERLLALRVLRGLASRTEITVPT